MLREMGATMAEVVDTGEKRDGRGRRTILRGQRLELMDAYRANNVLDRAVPINHAGLFDFRGIGPAAVLCAAARA